MNLSPRLLLLIGALLLVCAQAFADRVCSRCNAKAESDRWVYCPFCGARYDSPSAPSSDSPALVRDKYERVSWFKIKVDYPKLHNKFVCFEARYYGIHDHFAPVEKIGITKTDYINFYIIDNWTNYVNRSNKRLAERIERLPLYTNITIFAQIKIVLNPGGQDTIAVLVDDLDF